MRGSARPGPAAGILTDWVDTFGASRKVSVETRAAIAAAMGHDPGAPATGIEPIVLGRRGERLTAEAELELEDGSDLGRIDRLPRDLPFGYHRLRSGRGEQLLIVAPGRCSLPVGYRAWAWAVQLYAARSRQSWGIGDLADLRELATWSGRAGAGALLVSPMGAPNPGPDPEPSPYFPSTRRFLDPLLIRVEEVPGAGAVANAIAPLAAEARRLGDHRQIDRRSVLRLKGAALEEIWEAGAARMPAAVDRLTKFVAARGDALQGWATFAALSEQLGTGWRSWPEPYRRPRSPAVSRFAGEQAERLAFHAWIQWLASEQLGRAAAAGPWIIGDLPVGFDPGGFDAWEWQDLLAGTATIGAPPDLFNPGGQDWGLPPFVPQRLREARLQPFIDTVRAMLQHAGGVRIDHVMGLFRLWWVPAGSQPADGAYVSYPAEELLAVLAIESVRAGAIVIGEDLGTVEPGVRASLAAAGLLSTRLAYFEPRGPWAYPQRVLAAVTTHDLPTLAGAWTGQDLEDQRIAGIPADEERLAGLRDRIARVAGVPQSAPLEDLIIAAHRALASSRACLVSATLEDALKVVERPNLPGTDGDQRANWSLALPVPIEDLERDPFVAELARALQRS